MNIIIEEIVSEFPILITEEVVQISISDVASYFDLTEVTDRDFVGKDGYVPTVDESSGKIILRQQTGGGGGSPSGNAGGDLAGTYPNPTVPGLANKVDKVVGKSLIDDSEITRLAGVSNFDNSGNVTALANKADLVGGVVPSAQLPSFVDDVLEFANLASFPASGESGKIYLAIDVNKSYRWSGSIYVHLDDTIALGETSSTAYRGDRGKTAYDHSQDVTTNPHNVTKSQVGLGSVDNTSDTSKPVSTAQQTALDLKVDKNSPITGATKTKVTYDAKGLVTSGADATTADIADSTNKRYVTDAQLVVVGNTSGTNSGDNATNSQYSGLASSKEDTSNKSTSTTDSTSSVKFPVWSVILSYFDASRIRTILGISTLSGSNTGDQDLSGLMVKANNGSDISNIKTFRANLGVDKLTSNGDSAYTILSTDKVVVTSATLTASRTWTLPLANSVNAGYEIIIADLFGGVTSTNTLVIARAGSDTINGATSQTIAASYGMRRLISDGSSKWTLDAGVMRISDYIGTALTANAVVVTDGNSKLAPSSVSATTLSYLDATSSIQTQISNLNYKNILKDNIFYFLPTNINTPNGFNYSPNLNANGFVYLNNATGSKGLTLFASTSTAGTIAFMRRHDGLQLQGLECKITRKIQFLTNISGQRFFCGITKGNQFVAPTNVSPDSLTDIVGVCQMASSTNMQVVYNDSSGTATLIDLGSSYPCTDPQYNYFITIEQTTTSYIVTVERVTVATGVSISTSNTLTTNIPTYNTGTIQLCTWITNNATNSIASYLDGGGYGTFKN